MLIFDQLKKNDPHLRMVALAVFVGMFVLLAGLWWVQIVSAGDYKASVETQSIRTVRIPAIRGKILDRNGIALADNKPAYAIGLYLEDLSDSYRKEYKRLRPLTIVSNASPFWRSWLGGSLVRTQLTKLKREEIDVLEWRARFNVTSNVVQNLATVLRQPLTFDPANFKDHYDKRRALLYPIVPNATPEQIARVSEQSQSLMGVDLDMQPTRFYPNRTTAAHLLGALQRDDASKQGEDAFFNYYLPDYKGILGIEYAFNTQLRGRAGGKSVLVNSIGYRQTESVWAAAEPGSNVVLTIDLRLQKAVEEALVSTPLGPRVRGAGVIMDVETGDVLAMASVPTYDPNYFAQGFPAGEYQRIQSIKAEHNLATGENYAPGSIFKTIVALACLEKGLDPAEIYDVKQNPDKPGTGIIYVGRHPFKDTVAPGPYDLRKALMDSSNSYFITNGLRYGVEGVVRIGQRVHLGESFSLSNRQDNAGSFPSLKQIQSSSGWSKIDSANLCIGQGKLDVTPLHMTVLACAIANGGKVLWPRLVDRIESQDPVFSDHPIVLPKGRVRDTLGVKPRSLQILREDMLDEVRSGGTGRFAQVPGLDICGKTGTAQIMNMKNDIIGHTTWFLSFAPFDKPRYAVVVMIEDGQSGGTTCAPIGKRIYEAILERDRPPASKSGPLARN